MTEVRYVVCLYCDKSHLDETRFKWEEIDPMGWKYLQVREGGGKRKPNPGEPEKHGRGQGYGVGFRVVPEKYKTIPEMFMDPELQPVAENMKRRLLIIVNSWLEHGYIAPEELGLRR